MKFNSPHLLLPKAYQEIRDIIPARSQHEVPLVAERLLRKVESISALMNGDAKSLPADVTQVIFNASNLNMQEKKEVIPLLEDDQGVTISVMRAYIANRFKTYDMIASALGSGPKPKLLPPPSCFKPANITANALTVKEELQPRGRGKGQGGGFKGKGIGGGIEDPSQFCAGKGKDGVGGRPLACEYFTVKKIPLNSHHVSKCPWVSAASHSDLIQVLPKLCVGCLTIKSDGIHKCPPQFKEGGASSHYFCPQCKCIVKLCKSPTIAATYQKRLWVQR